MDIERSLKRTQEFDFQRMKVMSDHLKQDKKLLQQINVMNKQNEAYIRKSMESEWVRMNDIILPNRMSI
jgi:hypothetical protein